MGTRTFGKGGWLIAVTGIMQTIAVIVNMIASWTIIIVMHIIITLKKRAFIVDCCRMSLITMGSIGEWRVGQTQHGAAKSIWNFMHSGAVMTEGIHFEHMIWVLIIVHIALIHFEHVFSYITKVLRVGIGWSWQQTRRARSHCDQMNESI